MTVTVSVANASDKPVSAHPGWFAICLVTRHPRSKRQMGYAERYELLEPTSAEAVGGWEGGHYGGSPAVAVNQVGAGRAIYVGRYLSAANAAALLAPGVAAAGLEPILPDLPADVEAVRRSGPDRTFLFLLNHGREPRTVAALPAGRDLVTDADLPGQVTLEPKGAAVIRS